MPTKKLTTIFLLFMALVFLSLAKPARATIDCNLKTDEQACSFYTECAWDATANYCNYATSSTSTTETTDTTPTIETPMTQTIDKVLLNTTIKTLTGMIKFPDGTPVTDAYVYANLDTNGHSNTKTDSTGYFSMTVTGGSWAVNISPQTKLSNWIYNQPSRSVVFAADNTLEQKNLNFTATKTDSKILGMILKPNGTAFPADTVYISFDSSQGSGFGASADSTGYFRVPITAGNYRVFINIDDPQYNAPAIDSITIVAGETRNIGTIKLIAATKTIKGMAVFSDGRPVTDAYVNAKLDKEDVWVNGETDKSGLFSLSVTGGFWGVSINPKTDDGSWSYNNPPLAVVFSNNNTTEDKYIKFTAVKTDAVAMGQVLMPDGSAPGTDTVFVDFYTPGGTGFGSPVDDAGNFKIPITAGIYNVYLNVKIEGYNAPEFKPMAIASNETKNLGIIKLVKAAKIITGQVIFPDGQPITDANIDAHLRDSEKWIHTETDSAGSFGLTVSGGFWEIYISPLSGKPGWAYAEPPQSVVFATDDTSEIKNIKFTVTKTTAVIIGKILRPDGSPLAKNQANINFDTSSDKGYGASIDSNGIFRVPVATGTYKPYINIEDTQFNAPILNLITIKDGETKDLGTIKLIKASKIIKGKVFLPGGRPVTDAYINANRKDIDSWSQTETDVNGNFQLSVTGGIWEIFLDSQSSDSGWSYNQPPKSIVFANDSTNEEQIVDFVVIKTSSQVKGKILKPDGTPFSQYSIQIDLKSTTSFSNFGGSVDNQGGFIIPVTPDKYQMHIWSEDQSFATPELSVITVERNRINDLGVITLIKAQKIITGKISYPDGRPVTDVEVGAFRKKTQTWMETKPDKLGNYTLLVLGGSWDISIQPTSTAPDWTYPESQNYAAFTEDHTAEEKTVNFIVTQADAVVIGKILKPDGSPPPANKIHIEFRNSDGSEAGGSVDSEGAFRTSLVAGTYKIFVYSEDPTLTVPSPTPITIGTGETKDLGTIKLILKQDSITGRVTDQNNQGIGQVYIEAFRPDGHQYNKTITEPDGSYKLLVTPGKWEVQAMPESSTDYYNPLPPQRVAVESGITTTVDFQLQSANASVSGTVVNKDGNVLFNLYAYAELSTDTDSGPKAGGPIDRGQFSFRAPAGTYQLRIFLPPDSPYTSGEPKLVTLVADTDTSSTTTSIEIIALENNSKIIGTLKDQYGKAITGYEANIFATSKKGTWQEALFDETTGKYILKVSAGTWYMGYEIDPESGFLAHREPDAAIVIEAGKTITKDLILDKAGSIIKGRVVDPKGRGVFNTFVGISTTSFSGISKDDEFKDPIVAEAETDASGYYRIAVPAGEYFVKTFVHPNRGFINAKERLIQIADKEIKTVQLKLRQADLTITGKIFVDKTPVSDAFVWGWSSKGGYQETFSDLEGNYQLNVTSDDIWKIAAAQEVDGAFYKSSEVAMRVNKNNITIDIYLSKLIDLPASVSRNTDATKPMVLELEDGAQLIAPANAVRDQGTISLNITPDTRVPSQGEIKVVGIAYNFEARDDSGQTVSSFNTVVTISIPYTEEALLNMGASEDELSLSFWDETAGTWKILSNSVVNHDANLVTAAVDHFTRFAIVSAADITPPANPTEISAVTQATGEILLTWINPKTDFYQAKVYRSTVENEIGSLVAPDIITASYADTDVEASTTYYYTVRAVDPAGNESTNTNQTSAVATDSAQSLAEKLSGRILLQVEANGEAWYIYPKSLDRFFMGRPQDSFDLMRGLGLGISNDNLVTLFGALPQEGEFTFEPHNLDLAHNLAGMIILQIEASGEAYYIDPTDLKGYYLGRPADAFNVMREVGLGITNADLQITPISEYSAPLL